MRGPSGPALGRARGAPSHLLVDATGEHIQESLCAFKIVRQIQSEGTTILLVEQNAHQALKVATTAHVLEVGTMAHSGPAAELALDDKIRRAYLGVH